MAVSASLVGRIICTPILWAVFFLVDTIFVRCLMVTEILAKSRENEAMNAGRSQPISVRDVKK